MELNNGAASLAILRNEDDICSIDLNYKNSDITTKFLAGGPLLAFSEKIRTPLPMQEIRLAEGKDSALLLSGACDDFEYSVEIKAGKVDSAFDGKVRFTTGRPRRGWFHAGFQGDSQLRAWIFPWLNDGRDVTPTLGKHRINMDLPGHIHAALAGVPMIILRRDDLIGGIGFPLKYNYHHDSLAFARDGAEVELGIGSGRNEGETAFSGMAQYRPGTEYTFEFQLFVLAGSYAELADAWQTDNEYQFDRCRYYGVSEALDMAVRGREPVEYAGVTRYIHQDVNGLSVRGYRHSSHQTRISVYRQSLNAYIDYLLFKRGGSKVFRERAIEQINFLMASQTPAGWYQEDWQLEEQGYSYEVIGQDGGVTQVLDKSGQILQSLNEGRIWGASVPENERIADPISGRNIRGPRPDYLGITCLYLHRLILKADDIEDDIVAAWKRSLDMCLQWLKGTQRPDGSFPMTVSSRDDIEAETAPCSRLLVALDQIAFDRQDPDLRKMTDSHEEWIREHCVETQQWWGSHKDTGLTIDYGGIQTYIQYCIQRYEREKSAGYLTLARDCTYFNFFEHCPKQLEWLWHYSKGGIQEQSNYLQPDIDCMDNLPLSSWYKLAQATGDEFIRGWVDQAVFTTMHTLCDDPELPWYGAWSQYLVDYTGDVDRYDQNPVTENLTKYAGSVTPNIIEDLLLLIEAGYVDPEA